MTGRHSMFDGTRAVSVDVPVCGSENVMVPVIRAIVRDNKDPDLILLQRRSSRSEAVSGKLEIPGGLWKAGESPVAAVAREVSEETGVEVSAVSGVAIDHVDDHRSIATITPVAVIAGFFGAFPAIHTVLAARGSGVPRGQEGESHDVRWWHTSDIRHEMEREPEAFIPSSRAALVAYFALKESSSG